MNLIDKFLIQHNYCFNKINLIMDLKIQIHRLNDQRRDRCKSNLINQLALKNEHPMLI